MVGVGEKSDAQSLIILRLCPTLAVYDTSAALPALRRHTNPTSTPALAQYV